MSVKVTSFDDPAAWGYIHDDAPGGSHGGTLDPATVVYGSNPLWPNEMTVIVPCPHPGCGSVSYWPPGGGADALYGQMLHVQMAMRPPEGAAGRGATKTAQDAAAEVKQRVIATDGEERWVLDDAAMAAMEARA
jgi:hypothetical protein